MAKWEYTDKPMHSEHRRADARYIDKDLATQCLHAGERWEQQTFWTSSTPIHNSTTYFYDSVHKRWHQTWIDNQGAPLELDGGFAEGKMTLEGNALPRPEPGKTFRHRITWSKLEGGRVRQFWQASDDGGKTWSKATKVGDAVKVDGDMSDDGRYPNNNWAHLGNVTVDETTGDIMVFLTSLKAAQTPYRSKDSGKTWKLEDTTIKPGKDGWMPSANGACDPGVTIKYGPRKGRLLMPARVMVEYLNKGKNRKRFNDHYAMALYSDDRGHQKCLGEASQIPTLPTVRGHQRIGSKQHSGEVILALFQVGKQDFGKTHDAAMRAAAHRDQDLSRDGIAPLIDGQIERPGAGPILIDLLPIDGVPAPGGDFAGDLMKDLGGILNQVFHPNWGEGYIHVLDQTKGQVPDQPEPLF